MLSFWLWYDSIVSMNDNKYLCIECEEVVVHEIGNTCTVCMAILAEDESMYTAPTIGVYKFR